MSEGVRSIRTTARTRVESSLLSTATSPLRASSVAHSGGGSVAGPTEAMICPVTGSKITASVSPRNAVCTPSTWAKTLGSWLRKLVARTRSAAMPSASARMLLRCSSR